MLLLVEGMQVVWGVFSGQIGDLTGVGREGWWALPLGLDVLIGWGVSPAATMDWDGCRTFSHPAYCRTFSSSIGSKCTVFHWGISNAGVQGPALSFLFGEDHSLEDLLISERQIKVHLLSQF